ncbi:hypothetical protein NA78x_005455 [Anatilimnocola sp. NA78]|uniref:hypothetical protein n=1 Tax=Anatilimnocola sp. NA78 TaxID=3415683 RepID=UPI003CE584E8
MPLRASLSLPVICIALALGAGCARSLPPVPEATTGRLYALGDAYLKAAQSLDRGPKHMAELKKFFPQDQPADELLKSPHDGKPFVVVWNIDPRRPPASELPPLIAYEQEGVDGQFDALTTMGVMRIDRAELDKYLAITPGIRKQSSSKQTARTQSIQK